MNISNIIRFITDRLHKNNLYAKLCITRIKLIHIYIYNLYIGFNSVHKNFCKLVKFFKKIIFKKNYTKKC